MTMLILTRRINERVMIDDGSIIVRILGVHGNQIRLGFEAPKDVSIHREEIFERIQAGESPVQKKLTEPVIAYKRNAVQVLSSAGL